MAIDFNFMVGGEAGQGVQTVGFVLAKTMMRGGLNIFADQDYESRIRGGHNFFRIRVSDKEVLALTEKINLLVALNKETIDLHRDEVEEGGIAILDQEKIKGETGNKLALLNVPVERLAQETTGNKLMSNTAAMGAVVRLLQYDFSLLEGVLREEFGAKSPEIGEDNVRAARAGYDYVHEHYPQGFRHTIKPLGKSTKMLVNVNDALSLGAMASGCKFVAGYPMTPTTPILEYIADRGRQFNVVVVQAEDEISAINMVIGAAYAGVRAMTATSGGGFCLMVEGLSLAGMTETPIVVVLGQRPGPAIGLPTRTEQGELLFALHAGHGEFPRAILAPAVIADAFPMTVKAFNLADKYQTPVIIITDHHLSTSYSTVDRFDFSQANIDRGQLLSEEESNRLASEYKRHRITESGVSPRALPMVGKALVVTDSDEHNEEGHIIEDAETRRQMVLKRMRKLEGLRSEVGAPRIHRKDKAELTLVGWGSTYGAIKEAVDMLERDGMVANVLHLNQLWPFPAEATASVMGNSTKSFVVENNATGQLAQLIRTETGIKPTGNILKFDGRPFSAADIVRELKREVS